MPCVNAMHRINGYKAEGDFMLDSGKVKKILDTLKYKPKGLTITEISRKLQMNRNSVSKYLHTLLLTGKVEMHDVGNAKIYFYSYRVPIKGILERLHDHV